MKKILLVVGAVVLMSGCSKYQQLIGLRDGDSTPQPDKGYDSTQTIKCCDPMRGPGTELLCAELKESPGQQIITTDRIRLVSECPL